MLIMRFIPALPLTYYRTLRIAITGTRPALSLLPPSPNTCQPCLPALLIPPGGEGGHSGVVPRDHGGVARHGEMRAMLWAFVLQMRLHGWMDACLGARGTAMS